VRPTITTYITIKPMEQTQRKPIIEMAVAKRPLCITNKSL
jgi:hypothetical protein